MSVLISFFNEMHGQINYSLFLVCLNSEEESEGEEGSSAVTDSHTTGCDIKDIDDDILLAESGKIQFLLELLHNLTAEGHRTLVFSQSRKMLDIVEKILRNQVRNLSSTAFCQKMCKRFHKLLPVCTSCFA